MNTCLHISVLLIIHILTFNLNLTELAMSLFILENNIFLDCLFNIHKVSNRFELFHLTAIAITLRSVFCIAFDFGPRVAAIAITFRSYQFMKLSQL